MDIPAASKQHPTYEEVSDGGTGHAESIEISFDPKKVSYQKLLDVFWHNIDPTSPDREFCDVGHQYRTAIFFHGAEQEREAKESEKQIEETKPFKDPIVTEIVRGINVLARGRLSSGFLFEGAGPLQILSLQLRPRSAIARAMGRRERRALERIATNHGRLLRPRVNSIPTASIRAHA